MRIVAINPSGLDSAGYLTCSAYKAWEYQYDISVLALWPGAGEDLKSSILIQSGTTLLK
jgi:hypothetical protein